MKQTEIQTDSRILIKTSDIEIRLLDSRYNTTRHGDINVLSYNA